MPIAVAACFPWGMAGQALRALGTDAPYDRGIIVATDSRVLVRGEQALDEGRAVYILEDNAVLVFSGHVETGETATHHLMNYIESARTSPGVEMSKITQHFLRRAAEKTGRKRGRDPVNVMVGNFDVEPERATVLAFSQDEDFSPKQGQGVFVCGDEDTAHAFGQALAALEAQRTEMRNPEQWQTDITIALRLALETVEDPRAIGGTVQTLRVDSGGMSQSGFSYTTADLFDPTTWPAQPPRKGPKPKHLLAKVMD